MHPGGVWAAVRAAGGTALPGELPDPRGYEATPVGRRGQKESAARRRRGVSRAQQKQADREGLPTDTRARILLRARTSQPRSRPPFVPGSPRLAQPCMRRHRPRPSGPSSDRRARGRGSVRAHLYLCSLHASPRPRRRDCALGRNPMGANRLASRPGATASRARSGPRNRGYACRDTRASRFRRMPGFGPCGRCRARARDQLGLRAHGRERPLS